MQGGVWFEAAPIARDLDYDTTFNALRCIEGRYIKADPAHLRATALLVSCFLKAKVSVERPDASLARRRAYEKAIKSPFAYALMNAKRRRCRQRNEAVPRVGQIARSQYHYTVHDRPLMEQVWSQLRDIRDEYWERTSPQ